MTDNPLVCALGGHPIQPGNNYYVKVQGWERPGRGINDRSGSSLVLREHLHEIACATCIARAKAGVGVGQLTL